MVRRDGQNCGSHSIMGLSELTMEVLWIAVVFIIVNPVFGKYVEDIKKTYQKADEKLIVKTKYGQIHGFYVNDTRAFYGVPYAKPPIGNLRWMRPSEPQPWTPNVLDATQVPRSCIQWANKSTGMSEDCLYMNVYTPVDTTPASNLPVIVIIHGGVFKSNSGMTWKTDGRFLAAAGSIVVNFNYRLGALGFVVTDSPDITGNYGIMDQRQALKFVQENIQFFGGNPNKVTIVGPSAGAQSVAIHLTSHQSDPLFSQAILQGNPFTEPFKTDDEMASAVGTLFAEYLNCSSTDAICMRDRSADDILEAQIETEDSIHASIFANLSSLSLSKFFKLMEPWGPVIDGLEIDANPLEVFQAQQYVGKSFIIGSNKDDSRGYTELLGTDKISMSQYLEIIALFFRWESIEILAKYPPLPFGDNRDALSAVFTDYFCGCSNRLVGRSVANQNIPVYHYIYSFPTPAYFPNIRPLCVGYSCHAHEVIPAYGTFPLKDITPTKDCQVLSDSMIYSWLNFAHTGNPSDHSWSKTKEVYTHWPRYDGAGGWQSYDFKGSGNTVIDDYRKDYCDFWDKIGYIKVSDK